MNWILPIPRIGVLDRPPGRERGSLWERMYVLSVFFWRKAVPRRSTEGIGRRQRWIFLCVHILRGRWDGGMYVAVGEEVLTVR
jgi:hypothetical protein